MTTRDAPGRFQPRSNLRRQRRRRGWSENDTAVRLYNLGVEHGVPEDQLGVDARAVSRWELGKTQPNQLYTALLSLLFELPPEELGLPPLVLPVGFQRPPTVPYPKGDRESEPIADEDEVRRRAFLRWLVVAATNVALGPIATDVPDDDRLDRSAAFLPALADLHLDQHVRANASLWEAFNAAAFKPSLLPSVRDRIGVLNRSLQQSHSLEQHRQLCVLAGDLFQLAGEIFFDANRYSDASQYYAAAIDACSDANASDLWACGIVRNAFVAIYERQFHDALSLLDVADRVAMHGDGQLSTRHWVYAVAAEALAGAGDLVACQRALDRAEQVHRLNRPVANGGWLRFDGSRLAEQHGACFTKLGRPELAEPALKEALTLQLSTRRRGLVVSDLALVAIQRHEIEEACDHGERVIELARSGASGVITRRLNDLRSRLAPFAYLTAVKQFIDHLEAMPAYSAEL